MKLQDAEERQGDDDVPCNTNSLHFASLLLAGRETQNLPPHFVHVAFNPRVPFRNSKKKNTPTLDSVPISARLFGYEQHEIPNPATER